LPGVTFCDDIPFVVSVEGDIRQFETNVCGVMAVSYAVLPYNEKTPLRNGRHHWRRICICE